MEEGKDHHICRTSMASPRRLSYACLGSVLVCCLAPSAMFRRVLYNLTLSYPNVNLIPRLTGSAGRQFCIRWVTIFIRKLLRGLLRRSSICNMKSLSCILIGFFLLFAPLCVISSVSHTHIHGHESNSASVETHFEMTSAVSTAIFKLYFPFFCFVLVAFSILLICPLPAFCLEKIRAIASSPDQSWISFTYHAPPED